MATTPVYTSVDFNPFEEGREIEKIAPTSEPQKEIWVSCMIGGIDANLAYNESVSLELNGIFHFPAFKKAVDDLILRHEALRCTISPNGENLIIYKNFPIDFTLEDISEKDSEEQKKLLQAFLKKEMDTSLDLQEGPLLRMFVHKLGEQKHYFTLIKHHVIGDGWSTGIMMEDLAKMYNAYSKGEVIFLPKPPQISEYALEQIEYHKSEAYKETEQFWINQYKEYVPVVDIPTDYPRRSPRSYKGNRIDYPLPVELVAKIKAAGAKAGCSLVTTLLSAFEVFLYTVTKQQDIVVGLPAAGQAATGNYSLVGHCVNLLPIKSVIDPQLSFSDYLKKRKKEVLDAYDHQQLTFGELIKKLYIPRDSTRIPLVPVIFNIDMGMDNSVSFDGLQHRLISNPKTHENFEVYLNATGSKEGIVLEWSYSTGLFKEETIQRFHSIYESILEKIATDTSIQLGAFKPVRKASAFPKPVFDHPVDKTLNGLIKEAVKQHAKKTAITFNGQSLTYQELNDRANQLAALLIQNKVGVGDKVGISSERSINTIISLLAIIKTGAAYMPLDTSYPKERIQSILENAKAKAVLIPKKYSDQVDSITNKLIIEELLEAAKKMPAKDVTVETGKHDLVYVLHTSGSTGRPKGVCMGQQALVNLLLWQKDKSVAGPGTKTLQFSPLSFDVSFQEIFATFTTGGTLLLITDDLRLDPLRLLDFINEQKINRIFVPFVALQSLTENAAVTNMYPSALQEVMTAGEQLKITPQIVKFFSRIPGAVLYNQYGPTEAHVVTELKLSGNPEVWPNLPTIGKEIYNTKIYILDEQLQPVAEGETGELCISGLCLAEGYLNMPEITAEKFTYINNDVRIYRTGDLARFTANGTIEFLGRMDHQVKIRGFRIELGEIEAHLNKLEGVQQAVVAAQEDTSGNKRLVAYITSDKTNTKEKEGVSWHERWEAIYELGVSSEKKQGSGEQNIDKLILQQLSNSDDYSEQADEWIEESANRIRSIGAKSIVEIGCGGGQFIRALAPGVEKYVATDYSQVAIDYIKEKLKAEPGEWDNVTTLVSEANDFSGLSGQLPDLVLINSVIQYFPNNKYLFSVIEKAAGLVKKGGCIFIGDVQGRATLQMHHSSEQLPKTSDATSLSSFEDIVKRRMEIEDELLVDPEFFYFVQNAIPGITHVEVQLRKGKLLNETTKYHYDVWLYVNAAKEIAQADEIIDWKNIGSHQALRDKLTAAPAKTLIIKNIPNERIWKDYQLIQLLKELPASSTVNDLKKELQKSTLASFTPDIFWETGEKLGYQAYIRWSNDGTDGCFEAVFIPNASAAKGCVQPTALPAIKHAIEDFETGVNVITGTSLNGAADNWKQDLKKVLPDYMIPYEFVMLNKLPLTSTGKVDRKALPKVTRFTQQANKNTIVAPRTATERLIANIWSSILNIENISVHSDFFELGGHSLIAVKVMVAIEKETGRRLPLATLFENSTIEKLARMITADEEEVKWNSLVPIKPEGSKKPVYLIHGGGLNVLVFQPLGKYMDKDQPVYGMQALGLNGKTEELSDTMEELAKRYNAEILQNDPEGPYSIAGYSFGGLLAYEMARQLMAMGKRIEMLGILDTYAGNRDIAETKAQKIKKKIIRQFRKLAFFSKAFVDSPKEMVGYQTVIAKRKFKGLFSKRRVYYDEVFSYEDRIRDSYDTAWNNYIMQPMNIKVDLFRTKKRPYYLDDGVYLGWREYAKKGVAIHEVPGDHKTFLFPPHDAAFAKILQQAVDSNRKS